MGLHVSLDLIELDHLDKSIRFPLQVCHVFRTDPSRDFF
jgi:hypothetical protein